MKEKINKPRVFLSHSSPDKPFIEKLASDLRRCQIDPWLDSEEIRDGRSWLKVIFEDGIPSCDAVIVYLTEDSLRSKMVEKELDATVVEQISKGGITLLPYVSELELRQRVRSDVRALQCREWNANNYQDVLPTVVAEIWRSYLERIVDTAILQEKNRRLELELEVKRLEEHYGSSVFTPNEDREFQHILKKLDRRVDVVFKLLEKPEGAKADRKVGVETCRLSLLRLLLKYLDAGINFYEDSYLESTLRRVLDTESASPDRPSIRRGGAELMEKGLTLELQTYGLLKLTRRFRFDQWHVARENSEKMYRFKYWLEYNDVAVDHATESIVRIDLEKLKGKGQPENDAATARALETDRKISQTRRLNAWRTTGEGVQTGMKAVGELFGELERRVKETNQLAENMRLEFVKVDSSSCRVTNGAVALVLVWTAPTEKVQDSLLAVRVEVMKSHTQEGASDAAEFRQAYASELRVDMKEDLSLVWRWKDSGREPYSNNEVADLCWTTMLGYIEKSERGDL